MRTTSIRITYVRTAHKPVKAQQHATAQHYNQHGNGTRGTLLVRSILLARFPLFFFSHTDTETKTTTEAGIFISSVLLLS